MTCQIFFKEALKSILILKILAQILNVKRNFSANFKMFILWKNLKLRSAAQILIPSSFLENFSVWLAFLINAVLFYTSTVEA